MRPARGFALIAILVVVALLIGVGGTVAYFKLFQKPAPSPSPASVTQSPTPNETVYTEESRSANWKTYTNQKYSFSLKYPVDWTFKEYREGEFIPNYVGNIQPLAALFLKPISEKEPRSIVGPTGEIVRSTFGEINIFITKSSKSIEAEADNLSPSEIIANGPKGDLMVAGVPAKRGFGFGLYSTESVLLKQGDILFTFNVFRDQLGEAGLSKEKKKEIFNQILSTFRFAN